jgi:hypothetical protein
MHPIIVDGLIGRQHGIHNVLVELMGLTRHEILAQESTMVIPLSGC